MRAAVIDLGTNTFHLLIAEYAPSSGKWRVEVKHKRYVKLAEEGIHHIGDAAFSRGIEALTAFKVQIEAAQIDLAHLKAFGTAALRTADNAPDFLEKTAEILGVRPESISGWREAELIYKGVRQAVPFPESRVLIMDIGGGSVEFIIADRNRVFWQESFPVGVAVLWQRFHRHDPITTEEVDALEQYLETALARLWQALETYPCPALIGASGTFDVIDQFLLDPADKPELYGRIPVGDFYPLYERLVRSTLAERLAMPGLPDERIEMVVVAVVLIRYVLQKAATVDIYTSVYAMKEGMLEDMVSGARDKKNISFL